jgi:hypothetical protein
MMRCFNGLAGLLAGTGFIAIGSTVVVGCGDDFSGCEASRTCPSKGGTAGGGGTSGTAGADDGGSGTPGGGSGGSLNGKGGGSPSGGGSSGSKGSVGAGEGGVNSSNGSSGETSGGTGGASGASGANQGEAAGDAGSDAAPTLGAPPTIVSTTPANEEIGVRDDAEISITFSEPMNTASVEQAYVSEALGEKIQLVWTDAGTRLVITHLEPLEYKRVTSLADPAARYSVTIGASATDATGSALGADYTFTFSTLRDVTQEVHREVTRELTHPNDGSADTSVANCPLGGGVHDPLLAGDDDNDASMAFAVNFSDMHLPAAVTEWRSATVQGPFTIPGQNPFVDTRLGELRGYMVLNSLPDLTWSTPTRYIGLAAHAASQQRFELDVLSDLADHYEDPPGYPFGVLFKFQQETNADGIEQAVTSDCDETSLHIEYLAP